MHTNPWLFALALKRKRLERNEMEQSFEDHLEDALRGLPPEKIREVTDFVAYLRQKYAPGVPRRGSPEAILQALEDVKPLEFEPDELEALLGEIQSMREMETEADG